MKRHITFALVYAVLAMACGVFYREFTKAYNFTGDTALGKLHTHLFILGMALFLLLAIFDGKYNLQKQKLYLPFMLIYNAGLGLMCIMLAVRGICEVTVADVSDGAISGIAGMGHIILAAGIILFFCMLLSAVKADKKSSNGDKSGAE